MAARVTATGSAQDTVSAAVPRRSRPPGQPRTSPRVAGNGRPSRRATVRRTASSIARVTPPSSAGPTSWHNHLPLRRRR
ncbi:hypothetical protein ACI796_02770 [Geodermatophilus sp. SYSU D00525]